MSTIKGEATRKQIQLLYKELNEQYHNSKFERSQLHSYEWETYSGGEGFTVLGLIELYTTYITGYAAQIENKGVVAEPDSALKSLWELQLLNEPRLSEWYFSLGFEYPKLIDYVRRLDYLRLLVIEYIYSVVLTS